MPWLPSIFESTPCICTSFCPMIFVMSFSNHFCRKHAPPH
jgi:hypothetical protein